MNPVLKRILVHGGLTAGLLALVGVGFAEIAKMWMGDAAETGSTLRYRVPLMMAFWGFMFVAVCELVLSRIRKNAPVKPAEPPQDDAEKLLNELLAQAEAKMALEAESQKGEDREQKAEDRGQRTEKKKPEAER